MAPVLTGYPDRVTIAVWVHRIVVAENAMKAAQAEVAALRATAHKAGIAPRHLKAAVAALKRRQTRPLAPEVQRIVDAVDAVPMGEVEVLDGALSPVSPRAPLNAR